MRKGRTVYGAVCSCGMKVFTFDFRKFALFWVTHETKGHRVVTVIVKGK